jgi:hypothetical protein
MVRHHVPWLLGAATVEQPGLSSRGHEWLKWPLVAFLAVLAIRTVALSVRHRGFDRAPFAWYLAGVGVAAAAGYIVTRPADGLVARYVALALLAPVGLVAAHLTVEPRRALRVAVAAAVLAWAAVAGTDHAAEAARFARVGETDELRTLIDGLEARRVDVAQAGYWRAYKISFLAQEAVKVASTDVVRIEEYQRLASAADEQRTLVVIQAEPCAAGEVVGGYYLCRTVP